MDDNKLVIRLLDEAEIATTTIDNLKAEVERLRLIEAAARELLEVADKRGDSSLPHPADDPKLWTARMQTAWDDLSIALDGEVEE